MIDRDFNKYYRHEIQNLLQNGTGNFQRQELWKNKSDRDFKLRLQKKLKALSLVTF